MPTKESLTDQLSLTSKLAAQFERMAAAASRVEQSYDMQIAAAQKLVDLFNQVNANGVAENLQVLNRALKDVAERMDDAGKATESSFKKMGKKADEAGKTIAQKFPKSVVVATSALSGLKQGISNVLSVGKGITGFVGGFVDGLASITASIVAIPLKIFQGLVDMAARAGSGSTELAQAMEALRKQFGAFYGPTNKAILTTTRSLKGFEATGLSSWRVFGTMAERLNYIRETATEMGTSFNLLRKEFEENGGALLAYRKGLGLTSEAMKAVAQRSDMMGTKSSKTLKDMTKMSYALADAFQLDAKVISREVGEAMKDMGHFATTTTKSLTESVTFAHRFGLELKDIVGVLDKYLSFDDAAEGAANLSQAFGANIDSFALMKASAEGDVGKSLEILRKSFKDAGVDATKFTAVDRKLIAQNTGLSDAAIQAAFSLKKQSIGLDQVQKAGDKAAKQTMTQEESMQRLADAIERIVHSGMGMKGGFWDQWFAGIQAGIMSSKEFYGIMRNIQIALRQTYMIGLKLGRDLVKIVPGIGELLGGLQDFFKPGHFSKMFQNISDTIRRFFDPKSSDKGNVPKLFEGLHKSVVDMFTAEGSSGKRILEGFKTFVKMMAKSAAEVIKWLSDRLAEGIKFMVDLLTGKKKIDVSGAAGAGQQSLGFLQEIIKPMGEALIHAWEVLKDPLKELAHTIWDKFVDFMSEHSGILKKALAGIALLMFGPVVTRSIVGVGVSKLGGAFFEMLGGVSKNAIGAAQQVGSQGGGLLTRMMGPLLGNPAVAIAAAVAAFGIVGVGMSRGIEKLSDKIAKDVGDNNDKIVGAATAGIVQMLSFGSIGDEAAGKLATSFAGYSQEFTKVIERYMGKNFASDIKEMVMSRFDALINLGDFFRHLFAGDLGSAAKSLGNVLINVVTSSFQQMKFIFLTLPEKVIDWLSPMMGTLADWLDSLFQEGSESSVLDPLIDGFKSIGQRVWPMVSDIPGRLLTMLGTKLIPALWRLLGSIEGFLFRIPGMIFGAISDQLREWFGKDNIFSKYIFDPLRDAFMAIGRFIPFAGKYLGDAFGNLIELIKKKVKGEKADLGDVFPNVGESYDKYISDLNSKTSKAATATATSAKQIKDAAQQSSKPTGPADVPTFLHHAASVSESVKKLSDEMSKVDDKQLATLKQSFDKVLNVFGSDKDLASDVARVSEVNKAFENLSSIATSASTFKERFDKLGSIDKQLDIAHVTIAKAMAFVNGNNIQVTESSLVNISMVGKAFESIDQVGRAFKDMSDSVVKATDAVGKGGVTPALEAVNKMVKAANELNAALADGNINKIDIKSKLENVAKAVGLGGKATYTVDTGKNVVITVNMQVFMSAADVEKAIIFNKTSIITDRINFATQRTNPPGSDIISRDVEPQWPLQEKGS